MKPLSGWGLGSSREGNSRAQVMSSEKWKREDKEGRFRRKANGNNRVHVI